MKDLYHPTLKMGKKGKKGKKGKGGKKKGKSKEPPMTAKEAILAYQINIVEKKLEDINYEIRGWEEKNFRHTERNEKLKEEQDLLLQHLLRTARDSSKMIDTTVIKTHEDVIACMKDKWNRRRQREKELEDIKSQIAHKMVETEEVQKHVDVWEQFRDVGSKILETEIRVLEQELRDMQTSFDEMSAHLHQNLLKNKADIEKYTEETLAQQKDKASDKAMAQLDKSDRQEVLDNDWLKKEVQIHRKETAKIRERVEDLERTNLDMMSNLFECKVEDLKVSRNFYLTQCDDTDNLERTGILEMDLARLSPLDLDKDSETLSSSKTDKGRPKSATQKAVEDRVSAIASTSGSIDEDTEEDEDHEDSDTASVTFEEEDYDDYLHLGPVELKLLSLCGHKAKIHVIERPSSAEMALKDCAPDTWPVTQPMMKKVITPRLSP